MSSGADASDLDAALALLSGPDLVAHLRATCRRADYDAASRVLGDRDRRLAQVDDELAEARMGLANLAAQVQDLVERCLALKAEESRGTGNRSSGGAIAIAAAAPRVDWRAEEPGPKGAIDLCSSSDDDELEEGEFRPDVAGVSCKRKESAPKGDEGRSAGVSCKRKESAPKGDEWRSAGVSCKRKESAPKGDEGRSAGVSCKRKESAPKGDEGRSAGVSCKRKESASKGDEGRRAGLSCKRKAPASACSPDNDDDDKIPLSQLIKKRRRAKPWANGEPKKGHGDVQANSAGPLGVDRPVISPVNRGIPEAVAKHMVGSPDDPKVAAFLQGTGNGKSGKNGGLSRTMLNPPPTGSTAGNSPRRNCSKPDGSEGRARIGEQQGHVAGPENDAPIQVRTPRITDTVRRIVASARVGAETPMEHTDSSSDGTISMVLKSIQGQEKAIGGVHKTKVSLETNNGTVDKASIVVKDTREQGIPDGQVLHTKVLSRTEGIREQGVNLSPCQSWVDTHGCSPTTSDKPVSATLQQKNHLALHSEQMSVESSLPSAVTGHWKSSSDVLFSCVANKELCMQASCALHRQKKFITQGGITKFDAHRFVKTESLGG